MQTEFAADTVTVALPSERPEGASHLLAVGRDWIIRESTLGKSVGHHLLMVPGVDEAFGPDLREAMIGRWPAAVRRLWNGAVWDLHISSREDILDILCVCVLKLRPVDTLTIRHFVEFSTRVAASLEAGADTTPGVRFASLARPSTQPAQLRVLPSLS